MRRLFPAFFALTLAVLWGGAAGAQITLVPGPPFLVSVKPKYIAAADFNRDGFKDAAVSNQTSGKVTVMFGGPDGAFQSLVDFPIGRILRGIAAGDLNNDHNPDIVTVSFLDNVVLIASGNGDGTFNRPAQFKVGLRPVDVAIGNFDGQKGLDIATADQTINKVTVLLNKGGNLGFTPLGDIDVGGKKPKTIKTADLNADGFDDILTINTGARAADNVTVLLNSGVGSFLFPTNFTVGAGASDMAIADLDNDRVPDMAVLNAGTFQSPANTFSISILINQTETVNGRPVGTGFFNVLTPVTITCPATISGILIQCHPNFITSGDYDGDGFVDLAVSFFTRPLAGGSLSTPGLIETFAGHGDGSFEFATQVNVGFDPEGLVSGDFTGEGSIDIVDAEYGASSSRIIRSLAPAPRGPGDMCNLGTQCISGFCVDHVCCGNSSCPAGQLCNIPGREGQCTVPAQNGNPCTDGTQCESGFCVDNFCCGSAACPAGEFCNTGQCNPPAPDGIPCSEGNGAQCESSFCVDGVCCSTATCPVDEVCNSPGLEGQCAPAAGFGTPCTDDSQCLSGHCTDHVCCGSDTCGPGEACNVEGQEGACTVRPTRTVTATLTQTPSPTPTPSFTPSPQPQGAPCTSDTQCVSEFCVDGVCCGSRSCPAGQFCNIFGSRGTCSSKKTNGSTCESDFDCGSGYCQPGSPSTCQPPPPPTSTPTPTPKSEGDPCSNAVQCRSDLFCTNGRCCFVAACPAGQACDDTGECALLPTPTPTKMPNSSTCDPDNPDACLSGFCTNNVCCDTDNCFAPDRCDIKGFKGTCSAQLGVGEPCEKNTDCEDGLLCLPDLLTAQLYCTVPPTATPTFFPTFTPTPLPQPTVILSQSGGCSIGGEADAKGTWLLATFPILLGILRFSRERTRRPARRQ
jgi:hypothetical protein